MKAAKTIAVSMLLAATHESVNAQQDLGDLQNENGGQVDELDFLLNDNAAETGDATVPVSSQQDTIFNLDEDNMVIDEQNEAGLNSAEEHYMPDQLDEELENAYEKELSDKENIFDTKEDAPAPDPIKRYEHIGGDNSTSDDLRQEDLDNDLSHMERSQKRMERISHVLVSDARRPVYGVLTEPLKGDLVKTITMDDKKHSKVETERVRSSEKRVSYIPRAHVQFLEQAGVRIVPISYLDDPADIRAQLDEVNGIYLPGDSHVAHSDEDYKLAFTTVYDYVKTQNEYEDYFPMFLMGKSGQIFIKENSYMKGRLRHMRQWTNGNVRVNLLKEHDDTFLFHALQNDSSADHAIRLGHYFNKQGSGVTVNDMLTDENLKRIITPLATIEGSAYVTYPMSFVDFSKEEYKPKEEIVAIAEGIKLPLYMFTYNVEMTQFVSTDLYKEPDQTELIDKSIAARHHAQFIAHQIADEGRLNNHNVADGDTDDASRCMKKLWPKLIRHHKLVTLDLPDETEQSNIEYPMPKGLHSYDAYIIEQKAKQIEGSDLLLTQM